MSTTAVTSRPHDHLHALYQPGDRKPRARERMQPSGVGLKRAQLPSRTRRRRSRTALRLIACLAALGTGARGEAASSEAMEPGRIVLRNLAHDSLTVDARTGPSSSCDQNTALGVFTLRRSRAWSITADESVCWCVETESDSGGTSFGPWQLRVVPDDTVLTVEL